LGVENIASVIVVYFKQKLVNNTNCNFVETRLRFWVSFCRPSVIKVDI